MGTVKVEGVTGDRDVTLEGVDAVLVIALSETRTQMHLSTSFPRAALADVFDVAMERYRRPGVRAALRADAEEKAARGVVTASAMPENGRA